MNYRIAVCDDDPVFLEETTNLDEAVVFFCGHGSTPCLVCKRKIEWEQGLSWPYRRPG